MWTGALFSAPVGAGEATAPAAAAGEEVEVAAGRGEASPWPAAVAALLLAAAAAATCTKLFCCALAGEVPSSCMLFMPAATEGDREAPPPWLPLLPVVTLVAALPLTPIPAA